MASPQEKEVFTDFAQAYEYVSGLDPLEQQVSPDSTLIITVIPNSRRQPSGTEFAKVILSKPELVITHVIGDPNSVYPGLIRTTYSPRKIHTDPLAGTTWVQSMDPGVFNTYPRDGVWKRCASQWEKKRQEAESRALTIINNLMQLLNQPSPPSVQEP